MGVEKIQGGKKTGIEDKTTRRGGRKVEATRSRTRIISDYKTGGKQESDENDSERGAPFGDESKAERANERQP